MIFCLFHLKIKRFARARLGQNPEAHPKLGRRNSIRLVKKNFFFHIRKRKVA